MTERKSWNQPSEWFAKKYHKGIESGKNFTIDLGERGYKVNVQPDDNGKYHVESYVCEDRYGSADVIGDSIEDALKNAIREDLYESQTEAYKYAEMLDIIGYDELKDLDE